MSGGPAYYFASRNLLSRYRDLVSPADPASFQEEAQPASMRPTSNNNQTDNSPVAQQANLAQISNSAQTYIYSNVIFSDRLQETFREYLRNYENTMLQTQWDPAILQPQFQEIPVENWQAYPTEDVQENATRAPKRITKLKKNVSTTDIAKAIAKHTKEKAETVAKQTKTIEAQIAQEEQRLSLKQQTLATTKNRIAFYKAQINRLQKTPAELLTDFAQEIETVRELDGVQDVTIDGKGRIVVTTTALKVKKADWAKGKIAGKFQIRLDFSQNDISQGVRVLNITFDTGGYDTPTIHNTRCCWGNVQKDIQRDFYTQNLTELVTDMLLYCVSPFEEYGYLGQNGDKKKGWEEFFSRTEARAKKYSWENYDRENGDEDYPSSVIPQLELLQDGQPISFTYGMDVGYPQGLIYGGTSAAYRRNPTEELVYRGFGSFFVDTARDYYFRQLQNYVNSIEEVIIRRGRHTFFEITIRMRGLPSREIVVTDDELNVGARALIQSTGRAQYHFPATPSNSQSLISPNLVGEQIQNMVFDEASAIHLNTTAASSNVLNLSDIVSHISVATEEEHT